VGQKRGSNSEIRYDGLLPDAAPALASTEQGAASIARRLEREAGHQKSEIGDRLQHRVAKEADKTKRKEHRTKSHAKNVLSHRFPHAFRLTAHASSNHFIRPRQHRRWNRQTDLLGGFEIDGCPIGFFLQSKIENRQSKII